MTNCTGECKYTYEKTVNGDFAITCSDGQLMAIVEFTTPPEFMAKLVDALNHECTQCEEEHVKSEREPDRDESRD